MENGVGIVKLKQAIAKVIPIRKKIDGRWCKYYALKVKVKTDKWHSTEIYVAVEDKGTMPRSKIDEIARTALLEKLQDNYDGHQIVDWKVEL